MRLGLPLLSILLLTGCLSPGPPADGALDGGRDGGVVADGGADRGCEEVSSPGPGAFPAPDCAAYLPLATPAELEATPRGQPDLEQLAMAMVGGFVADAETYDRIVADVTAVRAARPELERVGYFAADDGRRFDLSLEEDAFAAMAAGDYQAWACLDEAYTIRSAGVAGHPFCGVTLEFKGTYDSPQLVPHLEALPGVRRAFPVGFFGGRSTICGTIEGPRWHYVFDAAGGDCPAGCTDHHFYYFVSEPGQAPVEIGEWDAPFESSDPPPPWFEAHGTCDP